jgi:hypothetical protein
MVALTFSSVYFPSSPHSRRLTRFTLRCSSWLTSSFLSLQPPPHTVHTAEFLMAALAFTFFPYHPQPPPDTVHTGGFLMVALTFSFLSLQPPPDTVHTAEFFMVALTFTSFYLPLYTAAA